MPSYNFVISSGVVFPDTATLQTDVENEYRAALGADLIVTPDTPEGALITAEVLARDSVVRNNVQLANQFNPDYAGGVFLDAIWALTGGQRTQATASTGYVTVSGVAGSIVATSARFESEPGVLWKVTAETIIGSGGTALVPIAAVVNGPITAPPDSITTIVIGAIGLESVTNDDAVVIGTLTQNDLAARRQRKRTLALQGVGLTEAVISALYSVENVQSLAFRENYTSSILTIDGVDIAPNSIFACVDGGDDEAVALALLRKSLGCGYTGDVDVVVNEPTSGQPITVSFNRPLLVPILVRVTLRVLSTLIDAQTATREAILAYAAGLVEGEDGFVVGGDVSPYELGAAVGRFAPGLYIQKVELALESDGVFQSTEIVVPITSKATVTASAISVVVLT